jgi:hypothetical protein
VRNTCEGAVNFLFAPKLGESSYCKKVAPAIRSLWPASVMPLTFACGAVAHGDAQRWVLAAWELCRSALASERISEFLTPPGVRSYRA